MTTFTIGIITCNRPEQLAATLRSVAALNIPQDAEVKLLVIDNDPDGSAQGPTQAAQATMPFAVQYAQEQKRGIPQARNKVLELAAERDYIAFIDDDDLADPRWLAALIATAREYKADVVKGAVLYKFRAGDEHLSVLDIFAQPPGNTGDALDSAWTNNVLFSTRLPREMGLRFDPAFTKSGGSDHHFFRQAYHKGARMVLCREAVVYSTVPAERTSFGWLARRHARIGATLTMSDIRIYGFAEASRRANRAVTDSLRYFRQISPNLKDPKRRMHPIMVLCFMGGRMMGLANLSPREYA
ncbi:MAG: glycosyltransferase family 2 protein [Alphaproteobacteria bacterium]